MINWPVLNDKLLKRRFRLLYPDRRSISGSEIISWARDEWINNAPAYKCTSCGIIVAVNQPWPETDCDHVGATPEYPSGENSPQDLEEMMDYLSDLGVATFAKYK